MVGSGLNVTRPAHEVRYWVALLLRRRGISVCRGWGLNSTNGSPARWAAGGRVGLVYARWIGSPLPWSARVPVSASLRVRAV